MVLVGIDWAEKHHDVCIIDQEGSILAKGRVADGVEGISKLHEMVADHVKEPEEAIVGIELDRGLLVGALVASGGRRVLLARSPATSDCSTPATCGRSPL